MELRQAKPDAKCFQSLFPLGSTSSKNNCASQFSHKISLKLFVGVFCFCCYLFGFFLSEVFIILWLIKISISTGQAGNNGALVQ